jgi:hypothetical protein
MAFKFIGELSGGIQNPSFGPTFLMIFLALLGIYLTLQGIVKHSLVDVIKQAESTQ